MAHKTFTFTINVYIKTFTVPYTSFSLVMLQVFALFNGQDLCFFEPGKNI